MNTATGVPKFRGLSFTALPLVAALVSGAKILGVEVSPITEAELSRFYSLTVFVACVFTSAFSSAAAASLIFLVARRWHLSRDAALFSALLYGLATPVAGWATMFFGHAMAGSLLIMGFAIAILATEAEKYARWDIGIGFLEGSFLSWSVLVEFTAAAPVLLLGIFAVRRFFGLP